MSKHTPGQWQSAPETAAERDRLLAVNAELLEACKKVIRHWEGRDAGAQWLQDLRYVVAKAEGKS